MRRIIGFMLCAVLLLMAGVVSATDYYIKLSVMSRDQPDRSLGSGGFYVNDDDCGRVILKFFGDPSNFSVSSYGTKQGPMRLTKEEERATALGLVADFYLTASATPGNQIRLRGTLLSFVHKPGTDEDLFRYHDDKLDFTLPNGGELPYTLDLGNGETAYLKISVSTSDQVVYAPKTYHHVDFHGQYELTNTTTGQAEVQGGCNLGIVTGDDGKGSCFYHRVYPMGNGDSLLYVATFDISDVSVADDGNVSFTVSVMHIYAVNPDMVTGFPNEIKSEKTTGKTFERKITARPNESTLIEIPQDKDSQLPFPSSEKLTLTMKVATTRQ